MNTQTNSQIDQLEKYSFIWSLARLFIAALALFLGGIPPIWKITPYSLMGIVSPLLTICWLISGLASAYLIYRWYQKKQTIFGGKKQLDLIAFFIMIITGFNLGLAGLLRTNIGMNISSNKIVFVVTGIIYLITAIYLIKRWRETKQL